MTSKLRDLKNPGLGTRLIHAGEIEGEQIAPVVTPIYRATTYKLTGDVYALTKKYGRTEDPNIAIEDHELKALRYKNFYVRDSNPNNAVLQRKMAMIEGCDDSVTTSSGMGAIASTLLSLARGKRYVVTTPQLYGMAYSFIYHEMQEGFGLEVLSVEDFLSRKWKGKISPSEIGAIYVETLSNPFLLLPPLDEIKEVRDELCPEVPAVVDNTFLTPVNFKPFSLLDSERDIILYSATKYLGGHSDVMAGVVCGPLSKINQIWEKMALYGCCLDPETAFYLERGLKTLHVRVERHNQNMQAVVRYLTDVSETFRIEIFHPLNGRYTIPDFARALVEQKRLGGMITFNIKGKEEEDGVRFMEVLHKTGIIKHATSLGGVESLISMPYNMSQSTWAQQQMIGLKQYSCLLRLSVGLEDADDIIDALDHAFRRMGS